MSEEVDLAKRVWSEHALMELLGVKKNTLRNLRVVHGLPMRRLQSGCYVALADEVLEWLSGREPAGARGKDTPKIAKNPAKIAKNTPEFEGGLANP